MKAAKTVYGLLLYGYPQRFRTEFGAQMIQTFVDQYAHLAPATAETYLGFWSFTIVDEARNIIRQQMTSLTETNPRHRRPLATLALITFWRLPLFLLCYAALVTLILRLPHPPVSGIGVLLAFGLLVTTAGLLSAGVIRLLRCGAQYVFSRAG